MGEMHWAKMAEATRCTIMSLDICLNVMVARDDLMRSLTVWMKRSISGTCSLLDEKFRFMPRSVIYLHSHLNLQSVCICVILKPRCRYNLCTIWNTLNFSVFDHTSCGKHDVTWYGVDESNTIDVHEVTAYGELFVLIRDGFGNTCHLNRLHLLDLAPHCLAF